MVQAQGMRLSSAAQTMQAQAVQMSGPQLLGGSAARARLIEATCEAGSPPWGSSTFRK